MVCPTASPHLNPGLAEPQPVAELLPHESVRVVRLVKQPLQLVQLLQREIGPAPPRLRGRTAAPAAAAAGAVLRGRRRRLRVRRRVGLRQRR